MKLTNKPFISILVVIFTSSILISNLLAQQVPQMRHFLAQEITDLSALLRDLQTLEKDKKLTITKKQAEKLIPILQEIGKKNLLPANDAEKYIERIENVLTDDQLTFLDKLAIEREKEREERIKEFQQRMQSGNIPNIQQQQNPQRQIEKEMRDVINAWQNGNYLNPFYYVPSWKKLINSLIDIIKKK
ncbi:MAG: hypothetical protein ACP5RW_07100 [bacterium]